MLTGKRAHDQATARSGKSITAADVLKAINEMDFGPADALIPLLEQELAGECINQRQVGEDCVDIHQRIVRICKRVRPTRSRLGPDEAEDLENRMRVNQGQRMCR